MALLIGDTERNVDLSDNYYDDDQGFYWLNFGYRVQRGEHDADGEIVVPANGIDLNGGSIMAADAGARPADLSYVRRSFPFKVDGSQYVLGFPLHPFCGFS